MMKHMYQGDNNILNDCGPAQVAALANSYTGRNIRIEDIASKIQNKPNGFSSMGRVVAGLNTNGVPTPQAVYMTKEEMKNKLNGGFPLLCLTDRATTSYVGGHFMTAYGRVELGMCTIYDPLRRAPVVRSLDWLHSITSLVACPYKPLVRTSIHEILELLALL